MHYNTSRQSADLVWFHATSVGEAAHEALRPGVTGTVLGSTSRGVFVHPADLPVLFISQERHRSPLTITLDAGGSRNRVLRAFSSGTPVQFEASKLILPTAGIGVWCRPDRLWHAPPPGPIGPAGERSSRLHALASRVARSGSGRGMAGLLPSLAGMQNGGPPAPGELPVLAERVFAVEGAWRAGKRAEAGRRLCALLGLGRGLTPSGDDFAIGMLLVLCRWPSMYGLGSELEQLTTRVIRTAWTKTTAISASMIEWAARGQADERLLHAVDHLVSGDPADLGERPALLGWGASSGVDALAGMALAISAGPDMN